MGEKYPGYVNFANLKMIEQLYEEWSQEPSSVDKSWQNFFEGMALASAIPQRPLPSADLRVVSLINAYRMFGHLMADCNPIAETPPALPPELELERFGFSQQDLDLSFPTEGLLAEALAPLRDLIDLLQKTYCRTIGIEYMGLGLVEMETWIQKQIEPFFAPELSAEQRVELFRQLCEAEGFEAFLHTKYVGQKRFSLEGAETCIPILHAILSTGAEAGVSDVVLGMAHRGRLNVLANIMGKSYGYIFEEFEDFYTPDLSESTGDVKYHMGFAATYTTPPGKKVQIILSANPSHLEAVAPVVEGGARAIQEQKKPKPAQNEVLPIVIHGDAAIAAQGVVYETLSCSRLNGYGTKGTIHIVINNQIGFTTLTKDGRSTRYCTDIAKAFSAPVFHVNAEDPESCVAVAQLALRLRQKFGCDVFIDLMGYRKYGHNESDEPSFTQPVQYEKIRAKKSIGQLYRAHLLAIGALDAASADAMEHAFRQQLTSTLESIKSKVPPSKELERRKQGKDLHVLFEQVQTGLALPRLIELGQAVAKIPEGVNLHPKVARLLTERQKMVSAAADAPGVDWGMGEMLAYASLCTQGVHVRLSGQDVRRGTFSHRHALYVDQQTAAHYFPLSHLQEGQAPCDIFNSPLSEYAVLGFEFGYSLLYPQSLVLWEAQFGDFVNGAQIVIDQFISASEMKWGLSCNLTCLLPHGYEGMGPEHSSGRMERFLQLCADENMIVANCTTPAQLFHLLRRQALRPLKKPLIVFTPKALLRHPQCRSPLSAFATAGFEEVLDDPSPPAQPQRVVLCSGKVYYDLLKEREHRNSADVLVRLEQLYPLHESKLEQVLQRYPSVKECVFVQEEPQNMGAWSFLQPRLSRLLQGKLPLTAVTRPFSASTAAGSHALHELERQGMMRQLYHEGQTT